MQDVQVDARNYNAHNIRDWHIRGETPREESVPKTGTGYQHVSHPPTSDDDSCGRAPSLPHPTHLQHDTLVALGYLLVCPTAPHRPTPPTPTHTPPLPLPHSPSARHPGRPGPPPRTPYSTTPPCRLARDRARTLRTHRCPRTHTAAGSSHQAAPPWPPRSRAAMTRRWRHLPDTRRPEQDTKTS